MKKLIFVTSLVLMIAILAACSPASSSGPAIPTGTPPTTAATAPPTVTSAPTDAPTATATVEPTATAAPVILTVISTQYCQASPASSALGVSHFETGAEITALGRDATMEYFYIENPDQPGGFCWIWNNFVLVNGEAFTLPVVPIK